MGKPSRQLPRSNQEAMMKEDLYRWNGWGEEEDGGAKDADEDEAKKVTMMTDGKVSDTNQNCRQGTTRGLVLMELLI